MPLYYKTVTIYYVVCDLCDDSPGDFASKSDAETAAIRAEYDRPSTTVWICPNCITEWNSHVEKGRP